MKYKEFTIAMQGMFLQARNSDGFVRFEVRSSMGSGGYTQDDLTRLLRKIDAALITYQQTGLRF